MSQVTTVKFNQAALDILDRLKRKYGATSKAEVLRKAVALLSLAAAADQEGAKMYVKTSDGQYKHIIV